MNIMGYNTDKHQALAICVFIAIAMISLMTILAASVSFSVPPDARTALHTIQVCAGIALTAFFFLIVFIAGQYKPWD